jgi:cytochrome c peroxidase
MAQLRSRFLAIAAVLITTTAAANPDTGTAGLGLTSPELTEMDRSPASSPIAQLGLRLFFDRRLSINGTLSCATCHIPDQGFTQNQLATPVGLRGQAVKRNSPTLLNIEFMDNLFHDGREFTLENQIWSPLLSTREMGNPSIGWVLENIRNLDGYLASFNELLGGLNVITLGQALAAYERTLIAADSPFDRWYYGGDPAALTDKAIRGFAIFNRHGCSACHVIGKDQALFHDNKFHNTGLGYERSMSDKSDTRIVRSTDTLMIETEELLEGDVFNDLGRYEVTGVLDDRWRYRTPTLRNVALTSPYMHDGSMASLEDVIRYYMAGGFNSPDQDPRILPFSLTEEETGQLVSFLSSLTSHHIESLVTTARQTEIGDFSKPD